MNAMTINQFPALANALMKETAKPQDSASSFSGRVAAPHSATGEQDPPPFRPAMYLSQGAGYRGAAQPDRRKGDRRQTMRDRRKSVRTERMRPRHTYKPGLATVSSQSQQGYEHTDTTPYAAAVQHSQVSQAPVDDVIDVLREESLYLQIMLMRDRFQHETTHKNAVFTRLEMVQATLQRELEQEARRLKQHCGTAERCGNLIDERG